MLRTESDVVVSVVAALLGHPRADASIIEVELADGVVTLAGVVESEEVRRVLGEIARQQDGVRNVRNRLRVMPPLQHGLRRSETVRPSPRTPRFGLLT